LFVIAQDLKQMRVLADVDEADVAKVREGLVAQVVVDAFPGEVFSGRLKTLSFGSSTAQGVVTYTAYIDVPNPLEKLRPGMTATVNFRSAEVKNAVRVPNAALRFRPSGGTGSVPAHGNSGSIGGAAGGSSDERLAKGEGRIRIVPSNAVGDEAKVATVHVGLSDGIYTEIVDGTLTPGTRVAIGEATAPAKSGAPGFPLGGPPQGAGGPPRGGRP
jgi:HlyD family secretion protein